MATQPMDMSGSGAGGVGAVGAAVGHRGGGFIPMSVAHGSSSRIMSPKRRGAPTASGPGGRYGSGA